VDVKGIIYFRCSDAVMENRLMERQNEWQVFMLVIVEPTIILTQLRRGLTHSTNKHNLL
jgi:hypothetical protein